MKWSIYMLLLVNIGLFAWHYQPNADQRRKSATDHLTRLVLLKEFEQQLNSAADDSGVSRCYSLGPFTRKQSFLAAKESLTRQGIEVFSRVSSERVRDGYWVMLPASKTSNQAKVKIQKLKEHGLKDYFLVATGEMKNAISLGVFSKPKLAKRRLDELEKQGFNVKIKKITLPKRVYWLEWPRYAASQPDKASLTMLLQRFDDIGQTERVCMEAKSR